MAMKKRMQTQNHALARHMLFAAMSMFSGVLVSSRVTAADGQPDSAQANTNAKPLSVSVPPLEESASRGISARDPSDIVQCKNEYWVFYTGRGVPSYHSRDLVKWERGPAVFKAAPEWIAGVVPENRNMVYWAPDIMKLGDRYLLYYS